jgi:hypothetical protein
VAKMLANWECKVIAMGVIILAYSENYFDIVNLGCSEKIFKKDFLRVRLAIKSYLEESCL